MDMGVGQCLVGSLAIVDQQVGTIHAPAHDSLRFEYVLCDGKQVIRDRVGQFGDLNDMRFRDNQHMAPTQGMDIHERAAVLVFKYPCCGRPSLANLAKYAVHL